MQIPIQVVFHGIDKSDAIEQLVEEKAAKLEHFYDRVIGCRVVIEVLHRNTSSLHRKGEPFHVTLTVTVPGEELVVRRDPKETHVNEDIHVAVNHAFKAMEQQLKDHAERRRDAARHAAQ